MKGSDTSTAESGSEAEDIASPKAMKSYSHLRLTPVREEVSFHLLSAIYYIIVYATISWSYKMGFYKDVCLDYRKFCSRNFLSVSHWLLQARVGGKGGFAANFSGYDEYVPMVDKAVDAEWKKQVSLQRPSTSRG